MAYRFAPVFLQARSDRTGNGKDFEDHFVRYDYDGNASGFNNWERLAGSATDLRAFVYAAVRETDRNYYLHYAYFHPRDPKLIGEHENDFEGALVVVRKGRAGGPDATDISLVQVQAHNRWDYARLDRLCRLGPGQTLDAAVCGASGNPASTHPVLKSQVGRNWWFNQGHGTEIPEKDDFPRHRITYVPWTATGDVPANSGDARAPCGSEAVTYVLLPLSSDLDGNGVPEADGAFGDPGVPGLWDRRRDVRIFGKGEGGRGQALQGDDGCKANLPWGWTGFGTAGTFFLDPTRNPAWSELRLRGVVEDQDASLHADPYRNDSDLGLFPPSPRPLVCQFGTMHAAFEEANRPPAKDGLTEGPGPGSSTRALLAPAIAPTGWDSCAELRDWVPEGAGEDVVDQGDPGLVSCTLRLAGDVLLRWPDDGAARALQGDAPAIRLPAGPVTHLEVRARAPAGELRLGGFSLQSGVRYDESLGDVPLFVPVTLGAEWTTVRFALNASPHCRPGTPLAALVLSPDPSMALAPTQSGRVPPASAWEVDRIALVSELASLSPPDPPPVIERITPATVAYGEPVTIEGSGFATPCAFNDVRLDDQPQLVRQCAPDRITFEARGTGARRVFVRTAGGTAPGPSVEVGPAR